MIKIAYKEHITQSYYDNLSKRKYKHEENKILEEVYNEKFRARFDCELSDLLYGSFEELETIKNRLGKMSNDDEVKQIFNYETKFQPIISKFFEEYVEVHTCYYCNIDSINIFNDFKGESKNGFTLDHVFDKGSYPYLALSLYNFVPSCYICNSKLKHSQEIDSVSPTGSAFNFDEKVKFKTFMQNENLQIEKKEDFNLLLKEDFSDIYKKYIEVFELDGRYEYHKYKVIEMINKRKEYPDSRIKELAKLTEKTEAEVKQDLFGEYLFEDDNLHKRPLSKLIRDISTELGLL
jgi:hypothetical protein